MTNDAWRLEPLGAAHLILREGKTFHQYTDTWHTAPRYGIAAAQLDDRPGWLRASGYYRLAHRTIGRSNDGRTAIMALLPPGSVCANSVACERTPWLRPVRHALLLLAVANSFVFDWTLRLKNAANINQFLLDGCPVPHIAAGPLRTFLEWAALRLSCDPQRHVLLWREVAGDRPLAAMPAAARLQLRAAVDAAVAHAYSLNRRDYRHVLRSFSQATYQAAALQEFDAFADAGPPALWRIACAESRKSTMVGAS